MITSNTAGTVKAAGLPNITGNFALTRTGSTSVAAAACAGAFYQNGTDSNTRSGDSGLGNYPPKIMFSATRSSSIYGAANTVQPPAVTVRYIIKY